MNIVHMGFKDHGWTRVLFSNLLSQGFPPIAVIEESSSMALKKGAWWTTKLSESHSVPSQIEEQVKTYNDLNKNPISYFCVDDHNSDATIEILKNLQPDLILFGTTRIIKPPVLKLARIGCINTHPSLLPGGYRGAIPFIRCILNDEQIGMSCHWATADLDLGDVISSEKITVLRGDTLSDIMWKLLKSGSDQIINASERLQKNISNLDAQPQKVVGPCFTWAEENLIDQAELKLKNQTYTHFNDT